MERVLSPFPFLERDVEVEVESEGRRLALVPIVPSLVARSRAAAALRLGFLETASFTRRVMAEELNSESHEVEMRPCWPLAAELHELGAVLLIVEMLPVFTCLAHPVRMRMDSVGMPRMERNTMGLF